MPEKRRILVFIDWFLPGYKAGGPIRSVANMTEHLSDKYDFFIVTSDTDYTETKAYEGIKSNSWVNFASGIFVYYFSKDKLNKAGLEKLIKSQNFDIAYINGIYSYFFSILPLQILKNTEKKVIVCARGMLSPQAFSRKSFKKTVFIQSAKWRGIYKGVLFHATTPDENRHIRNKLGKKTQVFTAANFSRKLQDKYLRNTEKEVGKIRIVSVARISQEKNTKFALERLLEITGDEIIFDIYGSIYDRDYWNECRKLIDKMPGNISVSYKGTLPSEKVPETFGKYHLSFMPSIGENFGHSLYESMAAGTPVLTSTGTPWRNLRKHQAGYDIDLSEPERFTNSIKEVILYDKTKFLKLSESARKFAARNSRTDELKMLYTKMFEQ